MLITVYDLKRIVHKEFVSDGRTVNGKYYLGIFHRLWKIIERVRPEYPVQQ